MTEEKLIRKPRFTKDTALKGFIYAMLVLWAIVVLFPFFWMILNSFKPTAEYNAEFTPKLFVSNPTLNNYITAFTEVNLGRYLINTLIYTVCSTALMILVTVPAAFAFARIKFRGKELLFTFFLALMMIPNELVVITNFVTITNMGLRNSFTGLILPSVASIFYVYLLKENFSQVPDQLYYASKVDGTSDFKYMWKVMLPICKPTVITITILKVIECWNAYVWPRLITDKEAYYLVSNGLTALRESGMGRENIPAMLAAVVVISIPLIVVFLLFRDKIMEGVARGGTKG